METKYRSENNVNMLYCSSSSHCRYGPALSSGVHVEWHYFVSLCITRLLEQRTSCAHRQTEQTILKKKKRNRKRKNQMPYSSSPTHHIPLSQLPLTTLQATTPIHTTCIVSPVQNDIGGHTNGRENKQGTASWKVTENKNAQKKKNKNKDKIFFSFL